MQYLNFSLKQFIMQGSLNSIIETSAVSSEIPPQILYILACVLQAYWQIRTIHKEHPCRSIQSVLVALTNPSVIYMSVEGCLKFLPLPIFSYSDNLSGLDKCMIDCCQFNSQFQSNGKTIVVPRYALGGALPVDKLDKLFLGKVKKMMKQIEGWISFSLKTRGSSDKTEDTATHSSTQAQHIRTNSMSGNCLGAPKCYNGRQISFWDVIESQNNIYDLSKLIKQSNFPSSLEFFSSSSNDLSLSYSNPNKIRLEQRQRASMNRGTLMQ